MVKYPNAASGIKKMFLSRMVGIIGVVLAFIPSIGPFFTLVCAIAATIFNVWGILEASKDHNGYQTALVFTVADLIFTVVRTFISDGAVSSVLAFAGDVMEIAVLYYICKTTGELLRDLKNYGLADKGDRVWNINKTCLIIMALCLVVAFIPILNILAAITSLIVAVVTIYAAVVYLIYLYQSGQYLSLNTNF
ncbi:hypothetical protein [uncultured Ruminococcus sp.]|uniref:hypothetical protein n=1 Tax=uncultured Ruminococcus sp. TaxID=165186 RepID=UPI0026316E60|nr:hypothetical protein [uncultured Ruminococcus sp.]